MRMWKRPLVSRPETGAVANLLSHLEAAEHLPPGAGPEDVFLVSYGFARRDWLRMLLADLLAASSELSMSAKQTLDVERRVPDADADEPIPAQRCVGGQLRLMKTERSWEPCVKRAILVVRHPLSTLVSRYHLHRELNRDTHRGSIDAYCKAESLRWIAFAQTYVRAMQTDRLETCIVSWDRLTEQPTTELMRIARFLQIDTRLEVCQAITQRHPCFDRFLSLTRGSADGQSIRQPQAELKARTYRWIESNATPWYRHLLEQARSHRRAA